MTPLFSGPSQTGEQPQGSQFLDASMPCACLDVDIVYDSRRNDFQRAARQRCWPGSTCACIGKSLRLPAQGQPIGDLRGITVGYLDHACLMYWRYIPFCSMLQVLANTPVREVGRGAVAVPPPRHPFTTWEKIHQALAVEPGCTGHRPFLSCSYAHFRHKFAGVLLCTHPGAKPQDTSEGSLSC